MLPYWERRVSANSPGCDLQESLSVGSLQGYPHSIHPFLQSADMLGPQMCITVKALRAPFEEQSVLVVLNIFIFIPGKSTHLSRGLGMCPPISFQEFTNDC